MDQLGAGLLAVAILTTGIIGCVVAAVWCLASSQEARRRDRLPMVLFAGLWVAVIGLAGLVFWWATTMPPSPAL